MCSGEISRDKTYPWLLWAFCTQKSLVNCCLQRQKADRQSYQKVAKWDLASHSFFLSFTTWKAAKISFPSSCPSLSSAAQLLLEKGPFFLCLLQAVSWDPRLPSGCGAAFGIGCQARGKKKERKKEHGLPLYTIAIIFHLKLLTSKSSSFVFLCQSCSLRLFDCKVYRNWLGALADGFDRPWQWVWWMRLCSVKLGKVKAPHSTVYVRLKNLLLELEPLLSVRGPKKPPGFLTWPAML